MDYILSEEERTETEKELVVLFQLCRELCASELDLSNHLFQQTVRKAYMLSLDDVLRVSSWQNVFTYKTLFPMTLKLTEEASATMAKLIKHRLGDLIGEEKDIIKMIQA